MYEIYIVDIIITTVIIIVIIIIITFIPQKNRIKFS